MTGIDSNKRLTKIFRESLNTSWVHPYIRARRFVRDYSLPVILTLIFLLLAGTATYLRVSQKSSLADLLAGVTNGGQGYGTLLSKDKTDELKKNSDNANNQPAAAVPAGSPSSFAINTNGSTSANGTASTGGGTTSPTTSPPPPAGSPPPAPLIFSASIASFQLDSSSLDCTTPKPKPQTCSKIYVFNSGLSTQNGPGTVSYSWRSSLQSANETSSFSAPNGSSLTTRQKVITLPCLPATNFSLQITIDAPTFTQSATINTAHNCIGI
ncbi:MAG: hypothetical protein V4702_03220 [Patescibacteria group bacterium]